MKTNGGNAIVGLVLIILGVIFLSGGFVNLNVIWNYWPLVLIVIGIAVLMNR